MIDITFIPNIKFTLIAIFSALFAAIANILARTLLKEVKSKDIIGINFLIMSATLLLFSPMFYFFDLNIITGALLISIALIDLVANYFYFKSFENSEASLVTPILSISPVFVFLFGWLLIGDIIDTKQFLISFAIILGIIIFSYDFKKKFNFQKKVLLYPIMASILFGLSAIPSKILLTNLNAINPLTLYMLRGAIIGLLALMFFSSRLNRISVKQYKILFIRGFFVITQWGLLYLALSIGNAGVTLTLGNITPIFVFILGILFLREKPSLPKAITAGLVLFLSFII